MTMPAREHYVDLETEYEGVVIVGACLAEGDDQIVVTLTYDEDDGPGSQQMALSVRDAYRLAASIYRVITEIETGS